MVNKQNRQPFINFYMTYTRSSHEVLSLTHSIWTILLITKILSLFSKTFYKQLSYDMFPLLVNWLEDHILTNIPSAFILSLPLIRFVAYKAAVKADVICFPYLRIGWSTIFDIYIQCFHTVIALDQVCGIQSRILM